MKLHLLIIDPQVDFCSPKGALYVPGAENDMTNVSNFIKRLNGKIDNISVTLDSHHLFDVAHPMFWVDSNNNHPSPFTIITLDDVKKNVWNPSIISLTSKIIDYVENLEKNNRYPLCIWPPHCLIGSPGYCVCEELYPSLVEWEKTNIEIVNYVTKGSNWMTEHYSAVQADVPDPTDPTTMLNTELINALQKSDFIILTGEALSHCVANTVRDIADNFGDDNIKKLILFDDCTSNVPGFENLGNDFVDEMKKRGMKVMKSIDFLA